MKYAVTHNDQILLGPIDFNARLFNSVIEDDTEIITSIKPSDVKNIPLDLGDGIKIREVQEIYEAMTRPKVQNHIGPFWNYVDNKAVASYTVVYKDVEVIKNEFRQEIASVRYQKEIGGTKVTVQGTEVTLDTSRAGRDIFAQKYSILAASDTLNWKFPEGWITLTKADVKTCAVSISKFVQDAFDWESGKLTELNAVEGVDNLEVFVVVPKVEQYAGIV